MTSEPLEESSSGDRSRFIRTFAKDMAALAGKPVPPPSSPTPQTHTSEKNTEEYENVVLAKEEHPFFSRPAPKEAPTQKVEELPSMQEAGEIVSSIPKIKDVPGVAPQQESSGAPAWSLSDAISGLVRDETEEVSTPVVETPRVSVPVKPKPVPPPTPVPDVEREGLLARLREKVAAHAEADKQEQERIRAEKAATPPPSVVEAVPAPTSVVEKEVLPVIPPAPVAPPAPTTPVIPAFVPTQGIAPSPFHSYSTDFSDTVSDRGATAFSVLAAEQDATRGERVAPRQSRGVLYTALTIVFLGLVGVGGYGAYVYISNLPVKPVALFSVPSLVLSDETKEFASATSASSEFNQLLTEPLQTNTVLVTYLPTVATNTDGSPLVNALLSDAPSIVLRNTDPTSTVGLINTGTETRPFFVLKVTSYERTFAGMLSWEQRMTSNLAIFYPAVPTDSTGTSTITFATQSFAPVFTDAAVANHDVRVYKDGAGNTVMLYGYVNKSTLIIARNEAAFAALVTRLK